MRKARALFFFAIIVPVISNVAVPVAALAQEGTCYLKATTDAYVEVYDLDRDGNHGDMIWQGRLKEGQRVPLKAPHARFRFKYNSEPDEQQALSIGPDKWCDGDQNVGVP